MRCYIVPFIVTLKVFMKGKVEIMLEIKAYFGDWKEVTKEQAEKFYKIFCDGATAVKLEDRHKYFNEHHIRGGHIILNGKVETIEEQKERIFQHYKNRLTTEVRNASKNENIRFNVVEYLCGFPKIDPFVTTASLVKDGISILYDDTSISKKENEMKKRKVEKLLA